MSLVISRKDNFWRPDIISATETIFYGTIRPLRSMLTNADRCLFVLSIIMDRIASPVSTYFVPKRNLTEDIVASQAKLLGVPYMIFLELNPLSVDNCCHFCKYKNILFGG